MRRDVGLLAPSEGLTLLAAGCTFDEAFRSKIVLKRMRERSGDAGLLAAYEAAVALLQEAQRAPPTPMSPCVHL